MLVCCTFMNVLRVALPCICIVASHLGTIDKPYEGHATGAEPEDDVGGHIPKMDGWNPMCMTIGRCSPSEYHLTNTDLVLHQASPGAHPIISVYDIYICFYYLCIRFRNYLEL